MHTDPISDLLTRIRNAAMAHHDYVTVPFSKMKQEICRVMKEKAFIKDFKIETEAKFKVLEISLFEGRTLSLKRISTPGQRLYIQASDLKGTRGGLGTVIVSTSQGIMASGDAKKKHLGGELVCEIF
jgi:small subunit ribosomal protein S8